ncbi:hypothetical protein [Capnocytophaga catalasegens]|uniref:WG repeat-containing protein n=1 Tax=Capnocytophaga catalasegens TaxID=1004260 RepID=A0AAV5AVS4_9FLAO|nr:hypothetical protein [Capnocytophaga catalasegens]GIZ14220.1 hypothetical protein RCZ03_02210 [Capnocytophaga catalasegens]GJM50400.1 hypothetical protein RCZ15_13730 [Capnocytophaga catalasegens]GJM52683.1 hypothetical protein RCZ16_10000 [Capnocytophaga catalasegens]
MKRFFILILLFPFCTWGQKSVEIPQIELIRISKYNGVFYYKSCGSNLFQQIRVVISEDNNLKSISVREYGRLETISEIQQKSKKILFLKDIKVTTIQDFIGKTWTTDWENEHQYFCSFLNKNLCIEGFHRVYNYKKYLDNAENNKIVNDTIDRVISNFSNPVTLLLRDSLKIYIAKNWQLIPTYEGNFLNIPPLTFSKIKPTSITNVINDEDFSYKDVKGSLQKKKVENSDKYQLVDAFNNKILENSYENLNFNNYFIIGENEKNTDIYTIFLEKFPIENLKKAYLYQEGIEVMTSKEAKYYSIISPEIDRISWREKFLCGAVNVESYQLKKGKSHYIIKKTGYVVPEFSKIIFLNGLKISDEVSFLNKEKTCLWTENTYISQGFYLNPSLLRVKRNGKYGLIHYDYQAENKSISVEQLLPFIYDEIIMQEDGLIYFYKENKIGIYPKHKIPEYDSIEKKTNSFYLISKNGQKGWLDIQTFKEYFD